MLIGTPQDIFSIEVYVLHFKINMVRENLRSKVLAEFSHFHWFSFFSIVYFTKVAL